MEKNLTVTMLLDFYAQLLTQKQSQALQYYYNEDYSLSEIGEYMGISRQGVRDFIKRGEAQLFELEEKLGLVGRFSRISSQMDKLLKMADEEGASCAVIEQILKIRNEL